MMTELIPAIVTSDGKLKITCGACQTRFLVPAHRVGNHRFRTHCRQCGAEMIAKRSDSGDLSSDNAIDSRKQSAPANSPSGNDAWFSPPTGSLKLTQTIDGAKADDLFFSGEASQKWFVIFDGEPHGPIEFGQLQEFANAGTINASTLVWKFGFDDWQTIAETEECEQLLDNMMKTVMFAPGPESIQMDDAQKTQMIDRSAHDYNAHQPVAHPSHRHHGSHSASKPQETRFEKSTPRGNAKQHGSISNPSPLDSTQDVQPHMHSGKALSQTIQAESSMIQLTEEQSQLAKLRNKENAAAGAPSASIHRNVEDDATEIDRAQVFSTQKAAKASPRASSIKAPQNSLPSILLPKLDPQENGSQKPRTQAKQKPMAMVWVVILTVTLSVLLLCLLAVTGTYLLRDPKKESDVPVTKIPEVTTPDKVVTAPIKPAEPIPSPSLVQPTEQATANTNSNMQEHSASSGQRVSPEQRINGDRNLSGVNNPSNDRNLDTRKLPSPPTHFDSQTPPPKSANLNGAYPDAPEKIAAKQAAIRRKRHEAARRRAEIARRKKRKKHRKPRRPRPPRSKPRNNNDDLDIDDLISDINKDAKKPKRRPAKNVEDDLDDLLLESAQ